MTLEQAEQIVNFINVELDGDADIHENYSGRGMYGDVCVGIVVGDPMLIGYAGGALGILYFDLPQRSDSMGRDTIIY